MSMPDAGRTPESEIAEVAEMGTMEVAKIMRAQVDPLLSTSLKMLPLRSGAANYHWFQRVCSSVAKCPGIRLFS